MEKKKKKGSGLYIPVETFEEAEAVLDAAVKAGKISFPPYESTIPETVFKDCKTTLDHVKAARAYQSNRGDSDVTDEAFFEMIKDDAECLSHRFAIEKIKRWQKETLDDDTGKAQDKLRRIGEVLSEKRSRKPHMRETQIVGKRWEVHSKLKSAGISKIRGTGARIVKLKELFGAENMDAIKKAARKSLDRCTDEDLADLITATLCSCSPSTVETYRKKKVRRVDTGTPTPIFISKKVE